MSTTNTIKLTFDDKAYGYAKIYASLLSDEFQRKRAYASILALYSFLNILEKTPYEIQKAMTLFRNPVINEQYEISDIYVNDWHLDVRVVTGGNAVLVPKIHYDSNIVPDFYVVIKVDSELKNAELIGFADTSICDKEPFDYHYYSIAFDSLISYDDFLNKVQNKKELINRMEDHELFRESYLGLMDNEIDLQTKNKLLKHLFECSECRTEFCCFTGFEMVSCNASKYPELLEDQTLNIIGAQSVDDKKYYGKEEIINIKDNVENIEATQQEGSSDETVSDILDELFNVEEDFIDDSDTILEKPINSESQTYEISNDIDHNLNIIENSSIKKSDETKEDSDLEIIDDSIDSSKIVSSQKEDVGVISEESSSELSLNGDFEVIGSSSTNEIENKEEMVLIEHSDDVDLITDNDLVSDENESDIQEVIVDYDENDKPVYSYITPVNQDEIEDYSSEIETIDDDDISIDLGEKKEDNELSDWDFDIKENDDNDTEIKENEEDEKLLEDFSDTETESINKENNDMDSDSDIVNIDDEETDYSEENSLYDKKNDNGKSVSNIGDVTQNDEVEEYEEYQDDDSDDVQQNDEVEEYEEYQDDDSDDIQQNDESEEYEEYQDDDSDEVQDYGEDDYDEDEDDDTIPEEKISKGSSKVALVILSIVVLICFIGGGAFFFLKNKSSKDISTTDSQSENNSIEIQNQQLANDMFEQPIESNTDIQNTNGINTVNNTEQVPVENPINDNGIPVSGTISVPPLTENDLIKPQERQSHGDVNKAIANAFAQGGTGVSLRGLNWFCTSELFSDRTFKNYLQTLDNTLKQNLKNNILNATQMPPKDSVTAKFAVDNNGNLQKVIISDSSGLEEIDNIVLQSIKESFEGEKSTILNDSELKSDMYYLKVVIKL